MNDLINAYGHQYTQLIEAGNSPGNITYLAMCQMMDVTAGDLTPRRKKETLEAIMRAFAIVCLEHFKVEQFK